MSFRDSEDRLWGEARFLRTTSEGVLALCARETDGGWSGGVIGVMEWWCEHCFGLFLSDFCGGGYYPWVNDVKHQQLLRDYVERRSEAAFADLVRRHVDFVYSAALRIVRDAHLAEDLTQSTFVALAQNARQLMERPVLSGWLHRTVRNLAANAIRSEVRRRAREQEAATMNELLCAEPDPLWQEIAPHLDAALGELSDPVNTGARPVAALASTRIT